MMKGKRIFDILATLSLIAMVVGYIFNHYVSSGKKKSKAGPQHITKANDILKYKSVITPEILNTAVTSSVCTLFLKHSAENSMNDYANEFIDHQIDSTLKNCMGALPRSLQKKLDDVFLQCKSSSRDHITNECYSSLVAAKTSSVATIILPDSLPLDLDAPLLLNLIADKYSRPDFLENPDYTLLLIDALLAKEPQFLNGYKIKLLLIAASSLNTQDYYKEMFQEVLLKAKNLNPKDQELKMLELAKRGEFFKKGEAENESSAKDRTSFIEELDQESKKYSKEWVYPFMKAYSLHENSSIDYQLVVELIEIALKKAPKNILLQRTLENLKNDDEEKRKHPFQITIDFQLNDL